MTIDIQAQHVRVGDYITGKGFPHEGLRVESIDSTNPDFLKFNFRKFGTCNIIYYTCPREGRVTLVRHDVEQRALLDRYNDYVAISKNQGKAYMEMCDWIRTIGKIHRGRKPALAEKFPHYYPELPSGVTHIDVYRVLDSFKVKRSSVQHAIKKLLAAGQRGAKDEIKDLKEARDSIDRALEMIEEENGVQ